jgi:hypothetical protein
MTPMVTCSPRHIIKVEYTSKILKVIGIGGKGSVSRGVGHCGLFRNHTNHDCSAGTENLLAT